MPFRISSHLSLLYYKFCIIILSTEMPRCLFFLCSKRFALINSRTMSPKTQMNQICIRLPRYLTSHSCQTVWVAQNAVETDFRTDSSLTNSASGSCPCKSFHVSSKTVCTSCTLGYRFYPIFLLLWVFGVVSVHLNRFK